MNAAIQDLCILDQAWSGSYEMWAYIEERDRHDERLLHARKLANVFIKRDTLQYSTNISSAKTIVGTYKPSKRHQLSHKPY